MNSVEERIRLSFEAQGLMATLLTVCSGEVRAYSGTGDSFKLVALMQATIVNVGQYRPESSF